MDMHSWFKYRKIKTLVVLLLLFSFSCLCLLLVGCKQDNKKQSATKEDSVQIGRYLFFDRRLSVNNTRSCATCHNPQFAFTDGYKRSLGVFADLHQRNTQALFNLAHLKYYTAADSTLHSVLQQMDNPLFNDHPAEMGLRGNEDLILKKIKADTLYQQLFKVLTQEITLNTIRANISAFILSLQSTNAAYDKFMNGDTTALTASQKHGLQLFFSPALKCASCHGGINFSSPTVTNKKGDTLYYFNTGIYNLDTAGAYPAYDQGLYQLTKNNNDRGAFRVPSLRNLAFTAPYYHDGSAADLNEVIENYERGGRKINEGIYKGNGAENKNKQALIAGFTITGLEKTDLVNFLFSLSDSSFINNPRYQNPFAEDETKKK
jgi:cytochrome c peroxidase